MSFLFSLIFPIIMYFLLAGPNKNDHNFGGTKGHPTGLFAPQYYMIGLLAFGAMIAVMSGGARIAAERTIGWNRQLRLTPLSAGSYLRSKIAVGYMMAGLAIVLLYAAGIVLGVRMSFGHWLEMTALILIALDPVRRVRHRHRPPGERRRDGAGDGRRGVAVRLPRRHLVPDHRRRRVRADLPAAARRTGWCRPATSGSGSTTRGR